MADNPFAKKTDSAKEKPGDRKAPDGKESPPTGKGQKSGGGKGNPFAKKMEGKHQPPRRGKKKPARRGGRKLQKFGQRY